MPFVVQAAVSMGAYTAGLAAAQALGLALRVSSATPVAGPLGGLAGVGFASALAGQAGRRCKEVVAEGRGAARRPLLAGVRLEDLAVDAALGVLLYKAMGGRFSSVMPSNVGRVGAVACESRPAVGVEYAGERVRRELLHLLRRDGCHHCGKRRGFEVVADHMPPNKFAKAQMAAAASRRSLWHVPGLRPLAKALGISTGPPRQRFYPQCPACSQKQAAAIRSDKTRLIWHQVLHRGGGSAAWHWAGAVVGLRYVHTSGGSGSGAGGGRGRRSHHHL